MPPPVTGDRESESAVQRASPTSTSPGMTVTPSPPHPATATPLVLPWGQHTEVPVPYLGPALPIPYFWPPIFASPSRLYLPPWASTLPEDLSPDRAGSDTGYTPEKARTVQAVRQDVQAVVHTVHTPADTLGHAALPLSVLREAVPPEVRHEETHLHTHRREAPQVRGLQQGLQSVVQPDHAHAQTHGIQALLLRDVREGFPEKGGPPAAQGEPAPRVPAPADPRLQQQRVPRPGGEAGGVHHPCQSPPVLLHLLAQDSASEGKVVFKVPEPLKTDHVNLLTILQDYEHE